MTVRKKHDIVYDKDDRVQLLCSDPQPQSYNPVFPIDIKVTCEVCILLRFNHLGDK